MRTGTNLNAWLVMSVFLLGIVSTATAGIIYVDADANGANDGTSWEDAFNYLQDALAAVASGDEIWVAQGVYKPDEGGGNTPSDRYATFQLKNGVAIYGGFQGVTPAPPGLPDGESTLDQRDPNAHETILSGDLDSNDVGDLDDPSRAENSCHVVTGKDIDATAVLNGFTITGGNANETSPDYRNGGGLDNHWHASPILANCTFKNNRARYGGGGISNVFSSDPSLTRCTFIGNSAGEGGGMYNAFSSPTLMNCKFIGNSASTGGGVDNNGGSSGAIYIDCTFSGNSAYIGGGVDNTGSSATMVGCLFNGNSADFGGGMSNQAGGDATLVNCTFSGNLASSKGGGVFNWNSGSNPSLVNCILTGNSAGQGGGMWCHGSPTIANCTIADNSAMTYGGGICCTYNSSPSVNNSILWGCSATYGVQIAVLGGTSNPSTLMVRYSDVQGGEEAAYLEDGCILDWGDGNLDADPCFVQPGFWDSNGLWVDGDYHLSPNSPCIDAGDNTAVPPDTTDLDNDANTTERIPLDLNGFARFIDDLCTTDTGISDPPDYPEIVDMGAYEFFNTPPVACIVGGDKTIEAGSDCEARVTLDGSCSSDADSTPGSNDDIEYFDWYEGDTLLGSGEIIDCNLPLGEHDIVLEVTDKTGAFDANEVTIIVEDTTPPEFSLSVKPKVLRPVNHKMVKITPSWEVSDNCDESPEVTLVSITSNEEDDAKGDGHTSDDIQISANGSIYLRAERNGKGSGRIYTITYQAVDSAENVVVDSATVKVPHDKRRAK